jgi:outer membrane protein insertion porin family
MPLAFASLSARKPRSGAFVGLVVVALGLAAVARAQGPNSFGSDPGAFSNSPAGPRPSSKPKMSPRGVSGLSEFATDESVVDIQVKGNSTVPSNRILGQIATRVGRPYDPKVLAGDVRKLASLPYFVTVRTSTQSTSAGRIVVLEVVERQTIRYIQYLGNDSVRDGKLAKETLLKVGGAVDPYAVEEGRRKIEELYRDKGFARAVVEVLEGNKPGDKGVVYVINEGLKQRVWAAEFEGNTFASDGQLESKIKAKPGWGWPLLAGKLRRDDLDSDIDRLTDYYRSFGFFRARIGRLVEFDEEGEWATIKFVIHEGPRYEVRNVSVFGNEKFATDQVVSAFQLPGGTAFERAKMQADIEWIKDLYGAKGYVFADVNAETVFLEEPGKIDLVYTIEEGERWRVGEIFVTINGEAAHTRTPTVLNRLSIRPGEICDTREFRASERRLRAAQIFETNPATGQVPKITYRIPEVSQKETEFADESAAEGRSTYRGQEPEASPWWRPWGAPSQDAAATPPAPSTYRTNYPPSVYQAPPSAPNTPPPAYPVAAPQGAGQSYAAQATPVQATPAATSPALPPVPRPGASGWSVAPPAPSAWANPGDVGADGYVQPVQFQQFPAPPAAPGSQPVYQQNTLPAPPGYVPAAPYTAPAPAAPIAPSQLPPGGFASGSIPEPVPQAPVNTQVFPNPSFQAAPPLTPLEPAVDVYVNVDETQTGRFMVGAAVNSDAGVIGQIMLDERNFDWRRFPRSWEDIRDGTAFRGDGQRFRLEAAPGSEVQRYLASWQQPYLWDTPVMLSLSGSYFDRQFDDWDETRVGGRVGLGYQWVENDLSASLTYRGEDVEIGSVTDVALPEYQEVIGHNAVHGFGVKVINDTRDNPFLATEGYYIGLTLEQVVGSFSYPRAEIDGRTYFLLRERPDHTGRHVLVLQSRLGFTGSNTPVYDRFYAGGFSTMRGFDFRGASPVKGALNSEVGGDFQWLNTVEYMFPLTADDMIHGVAFCDFGTTEENVEINDFRIAPGVGLRITVPAMGPAPIALDFAWPIERAGFDDTQVFTFNVGFMR